MKMYQGSSYRWLLRRRNDRLPLLRALSSSRASASAKRLPSCSSSLSLVDGPGLQPVLDGARRAAALDDAQHAEQHDEHRHRADGEQACADAVERAVLAEGDQRADPPDQGRQGHEAVQREGQRMKKDAEEGFHAR